MQIIYHRDLDGRCAAAIALRAVRLRQDQETLTMTEVDYGWPFPWGRIADGEEVMLLDFSLEHVNAMDHLLDLAGKLTWIDHHASAIKKFGDRRSAVPEVKIILEEGMGACELTWHHFFPGYPSSMLVYRLALWDVWKRDDPQTDLINAGMMSVPNTPADSIWDEAILWPETNQKPKDVQEVYRELLERGAVVEKYRELRNEEVAKGSYEINFHGHKALVLNAALENSTVVDSVLRADYHDLIILYYYDRDHWHISLYTHRTKENEKATGKPAISMRELAEKYGGGGHEGAAGFHTKTLPGWMRYSDE